MADYAFAGAGWISAVHGMAVDALPGGRVVAVASRTRAVAEARAEQVGGRAVAYEELPAGADIVVVATPPSHHAVDALRAMAGGAVAVVEKPLCATLDHADRLVRVVEAGGVLLYAENLLFGEPVSHALGEIVRLGPLTNLTARALQPRPTWGDFTRRHWGGGVFFDLGVHPLALVLRAAGAREPAGVRAVYDTCADVEVEDEARVELRFDDGLVATIEVSWRAEEPTWDLQAASAEGVVLLRMLPDVELERDGEPVPLPEPVTSDHPPQLDQFGYVEQLRQAELALHDRRAPAISDVHLGRQVLEIVCASAISARTGDEVTLPYDGPRDRPPIELWRPGPDR